MDIPEIRIVRRVLEAEQLDPVVALAVLVRTMMADHVDTLLKLGDAAFDTPDDCSEPEPVTLLDIVYRRLRDDREGNGDYFMRRLRALGPGASEADSPPVAQAAGDLFDAQDRLSELLAACLDAADTLHKAIATNPPSQPANDR